MPDGFHLSTEHISTIIFSVIGSMGPIVTWMWIRVVKPLLSVSKSQEEVLKAIAEIKSDITNPDGSSLRTTVAAVGDACKRIESRQKVIVQRTKAALHYSGTPLFETDKRGRIVWSNALFCKMVGDSNLLLEGYDWLTLVSDDEREETLDQFRSCLDTNRKFTKHTEMQDGTPIQMTGYPYRVSEDEHGGFLVSISKLKR